MAEITGLMIADLQGEIHNLALAIQSLASQRTRLTLPEQSARQSFRWHSAVAFSGNSVQIMPANPRRWSIVFNVTNATGAVLGTTVDPVATGEGWLFNDPVKAEILMLDYSHHGTLVGSAWFIQNVGASPAGVKAVEIVLDQ